MCVFMSVLMCVHTWSRRVALRSSFVAALDINEWYTYDGGSIVLPR